MKRLTPMIHSENPTEQKPFFASQIVPIGMKLMDEAECSSNAFPRMTVLFLFENKLDEEDVIFVQLILELEREEELHALEMNPFNIDNWSDEFKLKNYNPIIEKMDVKKNSYASSFIFTKTGADGEPEMSDTAKTLLEGITTLKPDPYYTFTAVYTDKDTGLDAIRKVHLDKGSWLQLTQFIYWITMSMPVAPNLFTLDYYKKAKFVEVTNMIYDGCTEVIFMGADSVMAHFTFYFDNTINLGNSFGFNIPFEAIENGLTSKFIMDSDYINLYGKDDTVLPDRIFLIPSPDEPRWCMITGLQDQNIVAFTIDLDTAKRIDWMQWEKYIYVNKDEKENSDETDNV